VLPLNLEHGIFWNFQSVLVSISSAANGLRVPDRIRPPRGCYSVGCKYLAQMHADNIAQSQSSSRGRPADGLGTSHRCTSSSPEPLISHHSHDHFLAYRPWAPPNSDRSLGHQQSQDAFEPVAAFTTRSSGKHEDSNDDSASKFGLSDARPLSRCRWGNQMLERESPGKDLGESFSVGLTA
jgi:hypothetical protein